MMKMTPRILYPDTSGPAVSSPPTTTPSDNMREREGEQARRGARTERKPAHARQIVRRHERDQRQQDQRHAAIDVLRILHPQQTRGDRDADRDENDDGAANRQRNGILKKERRGKQDQSRHGQNRAANQIVLPLCRSRTRPIP